MNIQKLKRIPNQQCDLDGRAFKAVKQLLTDVKSRSELNMVEDHIKNLLERSYRARRAIRPTRETMASLRYEVENGRVYSRMLDVLLYNYEIILEDIEENA